MLDRPESPIGNDISHLKYCVTNNPSLLIYSIKVLISPKVLSFVVDIFVVLYICTMAIHKTNDNIMDFHGINFKNNELEFCKSLFTGHISFWI